MKSPYSRKSWLRVFQISSEESKFVRRGFRVTATSAHLEKVGEEFLNGYNIGIFSRNTSSLVEKLNLVQPFHRGFAFEGAAMALALLDGLLPFRKKLLQEFLSVVGASHAYTAHVGIGWAMARIPGMRWRIRRKMSEFDPLLRWLILDGLGFHEGYFHPKKYLRREVPISFLSGYARRGFAQGLGRSLWFVEGADVNQITRTLRALPEQLHTDLWSGVGLACAYAGGVGRDEIEKLNASVGCNRPYLAQGVAFAAKARQRAGIISEQTEVACRVVCDCTVDEAAALTDEKRRDLPPDAEIPSYEIWRQRIQKEFGLERGVQ